MKKIIAIILLFCLLLAACLALPPFLLRLDRVRDQLVSRINGELAASITIGNIEWRWLPLPCLALLDIRGEGGQFEFQLPEAILYPSLSSRLGLGFGIKKVLLIKPRVMLRSLGPFSAGQELRLPAAPRVVVQDGLLTVSRQAQLPGILLAADLALSLTRADLNFSPRKLDCSMEGKAPFCESFSLSGRFQPDLQQYDLGFSLQGLAWQQAISKLGDGRFEPTAAPPVNLAGHIAGTGLDTIQVELKGGIPAVLIRQEEQQVAVKGGMADLALAKNPGGDFSLQIKGLAAAEPELKFHGVVSRQAVVSQGPPSWHIDLAGADLDLAGIRAGVLALWGEHPVAVKVCDIVQGGRARAATYQFDGPASDLKHLRAMTVTAEAQDALIHVPKVDLELSEASGPITIKDAVLIGSGLSATLGKNRGKNGAIFLGLTREDPRFSLDLDIEAKVAELPPILHKLIHHAAFNEELDRFSKVEGTATGHLTIGDSLDQLATTVTVAEMSGQLSYERIPWPVAVHQGRLLVQPGMVEWRGVKAVAGPHLVKNSTGRVTWAEGEVNLEIEALEAALDAGLLYPELAARGLLPRKIREYLAVTQGLLDITGATVSGPATVPQDWQYRCQAGIRGLAWSNALLPEPVTTMSGEFTINNHELILSSSTMLFMGQPVAVAGRFKHSLLENWQGRLELSGTVNEQIGEWVRDFKWLPDTWFPRLPCTVKGLAIEWGGGTGAVLVSASVMAGAAGQAAAPMLTVDLTASAERLLIKDLTLSSPEGEQARLALDRHRQPPTVTSLKWQGKVSASTLEALFAANLIRTGSLQGDWQMTVADNPGDSAFSGVLAAHGLRWQWGHGEAASLTAHLRSQGAAIIIEKIEVDPGSGPLEIHGTIDHAEKGLAVNMVLSAAAISRDQTRRFLEDLKAQAEKATSAGPRPKWQTGPFAWDITGKIDFKIDSYATTFKPPETTRPQEIGPEPQTEATVYVFKGIEGTIDYQAGKARTTRIERADLCGMDASATLHTGESSPPGSFELATPPGTSLLFQDALPCLGFKQELLEGAFTLAGALQGRPENWTGGKLAIQSASGRILRLKLLSTVLSVVNVTDLFTTSQLSDMDKEGFGYSELELLAGVNDNRLEISQAIIRGEGLNLFGRGSMDLQNLETDFIILVAPLKTIDTIIGHIPLIGPAVGGKYTALISIPVGVTGSIKDPQATILAPQAVGRSILEFFKSIVKLPFRLFNPLLPNERSEQPTEKAGKTPAPDAGQQAY